MNKRTVKVLLTSGFIVLILLAILALFDAQDGKRIIRLPGKSLDAIKTKTDQENVYVAIDNAGIFAISHNTGKIAWQYPTITQTTIQSTVEPPVDKLDIALGQSILYAETENSILALNTKNGEMLWSHDFETPLNVDAGILLEKESFLVVASNSGSLYVMTPTNGEIRWSVDLSTVAPVQTLMFRSSSNGRMAFVTGEISYYEGSYDLSEGELYVFAAKSGEKLWALEQNDWTSASSTSLPVIVDADERIYMASYGLISAFANDTGEMLWQTPTLGAFSHLIILGDDLVAIGYGGIAVVNRNSGALHCGQYASEVQSKGEFIVQGEQLFYIQQRKEVSTSIWRKPQTWVHKTDFYAIELESCGLQLRSTVDGRLVAYNPLTQEGIVVANKSDKGVVLKQVHISLD